jgi:hypothetical protein
MPHEYGIARDIKPSNLLDDAKLWVTILPGSSRKQRLTQTRYPAPCL